MSELLPALVLAPLLGAVLTALVPAPRAPVVAVGAAAVTVTAVGAVAAVVATQGSLQLAMGGWAAPLGIGLRADGVSVALLGLTAVVGAAVTVHATGAPSARGGPTFWPMSSFLWAALNAVYLAADLFNTYVALELMGVAAVSLVSLGGKDAFGPALRYLFVAVLGSLLYLLGVALVYGQTGTLDMAMAGERLVAGPVAMAALTVMAVGLALKTALFPLHAWLPGAHSAAPAAVSPLLSALVVKASFYVLVRVWFTGAGAGASVPAAHVLGGLGAVAVLWGGTLALRQARLKQTVAYSTVAQVGYLFLLFPLVQAGLAAPGETGNGPGAGTAAARAAWTGAMALALAHGLAKAAMFLAAGNLALAHGSDQLDRVRGAANRTPMSVAAFAVAGVSLAGLPPTFGFVGKWQLLQASLATGQWWWVPVLLLGGLLSVGYTARVVRTALDRPSPDDRSRVHTPLPRRTELAALCLAALAVVLGLASLPVLALLDGALPEGAS